MNEQDGDTPKFDPLERLNEIERFLEYYFPSETKNVQA